MYIRTVKVNFDQEMVNVKKESDTSQTLIIINYMYLISTLLVIYLILSDEHSENALEIKFMYNELLVPVLYFLFNMYIHIDSWMYNYMEYDFVFLLTYIIYRGVKEKKVLSVYK